MPSTGFKLLNSNQDHPPIQKNFFSNAKQRLYLKFLKIGKIKYWKKIKFTKTFFESIKNRSKKFIEILK